MPGEWHNKMEGLFPKELREIKFYCSTSLSKTFRRADICLNDIRTCEIQHSYISENEIINRCNDWKNFGKKIIWLVDGNNGVDINKLSTGNYLIIFKQEWKYKSFINTYDFILLEKDDMIFKIELKKIRSSIIELKGPKTLKETIEFLKTKPSEIWDFWDDENYVKSILGVYQLGAGNGKTYGIWKSITENQDKKTFIIVTKQHSAKQVINKELIDQKERFEDSEGKEAYHIVNLTNEGYDITDKHYVIKYTHKISKRECKVIIGTIDSFCYNLSNSNIKGADFFKGVIDNIANKGPTKLNNGYMNFGGQHIQLSKESEIWIDEVQDLPENYLHAMIKLMYETNCHFNVVGDIMQSLEFKDNFLTKIVDDGLPNIKIDKNDAINKNRRIKVTNMADQINKIIHFEKYVYKGKPLPSIRCDNNIKKDINNKPIKIIDTPLIYAGDTNDNKINNYCDKIMEYYKYEVDNNNYNPNDFLIIFPIMKKNVIASELQNKIQDYWLEKEDSNNDTYIQYAYLHKHTEGTVINTKDSINSTRIMSIRSAKGDGRKVTFVLGVTEDTLKIVSNKQIGIVYESYLHVALTRSKNQIYFGLVKNNDDIHKRFSEAGYVEYFPNINKKINLDKICELIDKEKLIKLLNNNIEEVKISEKNINQKETVDWGYHCIKYQTYYFQVILKILSNKCINSYEDKSQLIVILQIISRLEIKSFNVKDFYTFLKEYQYKNIPCIPLCKFSNKPEYNNYFNIIKSSIIYVQECIKNNSLNKLNVYESIILTYIIQIKISQSYAEMTPLDIYNITDFFQKNENKEKQLLDNLKNIKNIIDESKILNYNYINWNIFKQIELNSNKDYFKINKLQFPIIGNNDNEVIHIVLKSDISQLNYWDTMIEVLLERFLIYNSKSEKDKQKFNDKKIVTIIYILDKNENLRIEWEWDKMLIKEIKNELKLTLKRHFQSYHSDIYNYFKFIKNSKNVLWKTEPNEIIENILQKCEDMGNCPNYIIDFFKYISDKIDEEDDYDFLNDLEEFNKKLTNKLEKSINIYLK